ncbi:CoA-transferase family III [Aspergillus carlsbadensis]|nr:CoA-transferase family III [Aspergillus carlsbadensis]
MSSYSVPIESQKVLENGILNHPYQAVPAEAKTLFNKVKFVGRDRPSMPINWRFAESVAALKGFEAIMLNLLLSRKYHLPPQEITINTDHAQLFLMSFFLLEVNPPTLESPIKTTELRELNATHAKHFPSWDLHHQVSSQYRKAVTNIYKTRDQRFYHLHASLNPDLSLEALGLPWDMPELKTIEESWAPFATKMVEKDAAEWDSILAEGFKQAGTICHTPDEYGQTPQGKSHSNVGLYDIQHFPDSSVKAGWWPSVEATSVKRPLAGLKVVDLTRIVAGPSISRGLAELGASVMRITGPHIADFSGLHPDLNWGKWNAHLDLRQEDDRAKFRELLLDADIVVNGYRPGVLDKYGAGYESVFALGKQRGRGYIYARENCFGWGGPWSHRSGWQPISDACTGVAMGFGQAMGNDEPVVPVLPNSDYCVGIAGVCGVLEALIQRAEQGGSFLVNLALNYYNKWLVDHVGEYPGPVWDEVWVRNGRKVFRHYHSMNYTAPRYMEMFREQGMFDVEFFEIRTSNALGLKFRVPKPVLQFPPETVEPGYNVGTRGNGVDQPYWPSDLMTEVVK